VEQSLVFIKPDGVERGIIGEIISRFEKVGLTIVALKMLWIDADHAKKHYSAHVDKSFYPPVEKYVTSGPVVAMVLEGIGAVALVRKLVGGTEPHGAQPGTIRGDYAHVNYAYADENGIGLKNIIHASGNLEEAKQEVSLWFKPEEIHSYAPVNNKHVMN
jgi:nucleoside-diphosphate kinase